MIKVSIHKNGIITNSAQFETQTEVNTWIISQEAVKAFGKPDRWVHEHDLSILGEDRSLATESQDIGDPESLEKKYHFASEYSITQEDITAAVAQKVINEEALKYLTATDWFITRCFEIGVAVPANITSERAAARARIVR